MVELLDVFGDDLMIVNAARVSYGKNKKSMDLNDVKLIEFLIKHKHTSPFRHPQLQFRISCPIYVERQLFKHQIGLSANSISGRYVDFSDEYSRIGTWRRQSGKQGSSGYIESQQECREIESQIIELCSAAYDRLIELGVSKEQARTILPLNLTTTFIWTGSLLAFLHLFNLRLKENTQQETREIVEQMLKAVKDTEKFQNSLTAWSSSL